MAIWTAEITEATNLDTDGKHEVTFILIRPDGKTLTIDGKTIYLRSTGNPTTIKDNISEVAAKFASEVIAAENLKVGDKVEFEV